MKYPFRVLYWMAKVKALDAWDHTASMIQMIALVNSDGKTIIPFEVFHPYRNTPEEFLKEMKEKKTTGLSISDFVDKFAGDGSGDVVVIRDK